MHTAAYPLLCDVLRDVETVLHRHRDIVRLLIVRGPETIAALRRHHGRQNFDADLLDALDALVRVGRVPTFTDRAIVLQPLAQRLRAAGAVPRMREDCEDVVLDDEGIASDADIALGDLTVLARMIAEYWLAVGALAAVGAAIHGRMTPA